MHRMFQDVKNSFNDNSNGSIFFSNGQRMQTSVDISYLGIHVTKKIDPKHEIRKRISATMAVLKTLDIFLSSTLAAAKNGSC